MIITAHAYARAGLVGNPSDGYFGKTISILVRNFHATVRLWESPHFEILPTFGDMGRFDSVGDFLRDVKLHGYYGGMRLVKATIRRFHGYCTQRGIELRPRNFTISYESDIPRLVGLAGSSAIIVAVMRALMQFYDVQIAQHELPSLVLSVEKDELGISAGLQDRVIQIYEGIVYMDFDRALMESRGYGIYESLTPQKLPPIYIAYDAARAEVSDIPHRNLRELFNRGEPAVVEAMRKYRDLTDRGREALMAPENLRMVEVARSAGASAKFAGSGGAIIGLYRDGKRYQQLSDALAALRCTVIRPIIFDA
jgi:glucuronokinase